MIRTVSSTNMWERTRTTDGFYVLKEDRHCIGGDPRVHLHSGHLRDHMDGGRWCGSDDEITGLIIPHVSRKWNIRLTARRSAHPPGLKCMAMYCSSSEDNISLNELFVTAESRCFACSLLFFASSGPPRCTMLVSSTSEIRVRSAMAAASFKEKPAASHFLSAGSPIRTAEGKPGSSLTSGTLDAV